MPRPKYLAICKENVLLYKQQKLQDLGNPRWQFWSISFRCKVLFLLKKANKLVSFFHIFLAAMFIAFPVHCLNMFDLNNNIQMFKF